MTNLEKCFLEIENILEDGTFYKKNKDKITRIYMCEDRTVFVFNNREEQHVLFAHCTLYNWYKKYKETIKLTKFERDVLESTLGNQNFNSYGFLVSMKEKGYFKNVKDVSMKIDSIILNSEVVDE